MDTRIPATVIFGATGAGKTSAIRKLLTQRPRDERWAVLINDFGSTTLDGASGIAEGEVAVREVTGCICCTARVGLRTALIDLVRRAKPQRLLIEASAAAEPAAMLRVLREPGIASAVALHATIAAVDPRQIADARYADLDVYRGQLAAADTVVLTAGDESQRSDARATLKRLISTNASVVDRLVFDRID